jgi:dCTP deaminase
MGALSGKELRKLLLEPDVDKRLVITPLLEPNEQLRDDQASVDVRLGFDFALVSPSKYASIDELEGSSLFANPEAFPALYRRHYVPFGECLVIHPHQFILASTLEYIRLPWELMAYVVGRSTWGRLGLIVATAVGVQPRFAGTLTLELRNLGETPINLYPGEVIAQLFVHRIEGASGDPAHKVGQYTGLIDLIPRQLSSGTTKSKLKKLGRR